MSYLKPQTSRDPREAMNLALDQELEPEARVALNAHFEQTPVDAHRWQRMQRIDRMLRTAPMTNAPAGFAERVMAALLAGRKAQPDRDPRAGIGIAVGVWLASALAIPILGAALYVLARLLLDSATLASAVHAARVLWANFVDLMNTLKIQAKALPLALLLATVPLTVACAGLARLLGARAPEITYRIPVQVLS
ncbi:MAG: anti-sigma factor family protein [Aggregatilineales bacterium]